MYPYVFMVVDLSRVSLHSHTEHILGFHFASIHDSFTADNCSKFTKHEHVGHILVLLYSYGSG